MIYIFSTRKADALGLGEKSAWAEIVKIPKDNITARSFAVSAGHKYQADDQAYLDISGLSPAELKKALKSLKKSCAGSFWGIIDPKGTAEDPASFFFEGACDYIGQAVVAKGLSKKRFAAALSWAIAAKTLSPASQASGYQPAAFQSDEKRKSKTLPVGKVPLPAGKVLSPVSKAKLPAVKFGGWKSLHAGTTAPFFFLFVSLAGKSNLRTLVGETAFSAVRNRLREALLQGLHEADALLWMETEVNSIFLVPAIAANGKAAIEASLKMILNSRLISIEKLGLSVPVDFTFALHYGKTVFRAPGKTGAVVSEPVNYIFHLGTKKADTGRLTVSDDVPAEAFPEGLLDIFSPAGVFEGIPIRHSRRFVNK